MAKTLYDRVNEIKTRHLSPQSVTGDKIATNAIEEKHIKNQAVRLRHLGPDVPAIGIADGSITASKLATNAVEHTKIKDGAVTAEKIASSAVTSDKIAGGAVLSAGLAGNAVTTEKIAGNAVTAEKIAGNAVTKEKIADNAVETAKIKDANVTPAKLSPENFTGHYADVPSITALLDDYVNKGFVTGDLPASLYAMVDAQQWKDAFNATNPNQGVPAGIDTAYHAHILSSAFFDMYVLSLG